jgi:Cytochrome C oxidase, cbb3-type, subunit III
VIPRKLTALPKCANVSTNSKRLRNERLFLLGEKQQREERIITMMPPRFLFLTLIPGMIFSMPREALPLDAPEWPADYRLHLEGAATVNLSKDLSLSLGKNGHHDVAVEYPATSAPVLRVWHDGKLVRGPEEVPALLAAGMKNFPDADLSLGGDFTVLTRFETIGGGTLFSLCSPSGRWEPRAKAFFIRDGKLVYDIGGLGQMSGNPIVNDGRAHTAVLMVKDGKARILLDGKQIAEKAGFTQPDPSQQVFKLGHATPDFAGDFTKGRIHELKLWKRALPEGEIGLLFEEGGKSANTPDFYDVWDTPSKPRIEGATGWVQALERSDHTDIVAGWNRKSLAEGRKIYQNSCVICHGTHEQPGSLPTALRFSEGAFKNGSDPYSMYLTLTHGYGQMVAQPQYTTAQKYAVIQYIREVFLRPHNPSQLSNVDLPSLPRGLTRGIKEQTDTSLAPYKRMELGNSLFWTLEVAPGNIAQKGIAVRLDEGSGGVTKGRAWMVYEHDTMRVAAATTGSFVDWRGIAFDDSHGTHTKLTGERHFTLPVEPAWSLADFADPREKAKDGKKYGPVAGLRFEGLYSHGEKTVIATNIHGTRVLESPSWLDHATTPLFIRSLNVAESKVPLRLRVAPVDVNVLLLGDGGLAKEGQYWVATLPSGAKSRLFISRADPATLETLAGTVTTSLDLTWLTQGGPARWSQSVNTTSVAGDPAAAFIADEFPLPHENPWQSWLRPGGFDFTPDGKAAIVSMWNGDVWRVEGVVEKAPAKLTWRRIATGLFQPLGVKFRGDELFVLCRDQLAKLVDLNGDGETDFIQCFSNGAQVTEHFHEFAMGLQTDAAGNFYYAKSARHGLDSVIPHHGTMLKVSADGGRTEILAPKNRINRVKPGGFYGNMFGYTNVTDSSDSAMEQPMVWITNAMDRSPAELVWVPENAWGNLGGSLLNLSYGTGRAYIVPHEETQGTWQGAVCPLPMPAFATGIMRGRFAADGALYTCGMYAWAGNAITPGGFYRLRRGETPANLPLAVHASKGALRVTFSDPVEPGNCAMKVWSLRRTEHYGSKHFDEHPLSINGVKRSPDGCTLTFEIPDLAPTHCYELKVADRVIHGTIHHLGPSI